MCGNKEMNYKKFKKRKKRNKDVPGNIRRCRETCLSESQINHYIISVGNCEIRFNPKLTYTIKVSSSFTVNLLFILTLREKLSK